MIAPYPHQTEAVQKAHLSYGYGWFMEMGTGKSKVFLDNLANIAWLTTLNTHAALILAPKGAYMNWVNNEIPKHYKSPCSVEYWSAEHTPRRVQALMDWCKLPLNTTKILVMNIESIATARGFLVAETFLKNNTSVMCVDESTSIKSHKAQRTKAVLKLGVLARFRRVMSGTPITQSPLDIYTQMKFLDPKVLGFSSFYAFRNQYAKMVTINLGNRSFQKVEGFKNLDELQAKIQSVSFRCLKKDCLSLPEKIYTTRYVGMSAAQKKAYQSLKEKAVIEMESGMVTVPHALTLILRMQQVLCGHTKLDSGQVVDIEPHEENPRIKVLLEVVEEAAGKVIIWCNYQRDVINICGVLADAHGVESVVHYYGGTGEEDRAESLKRFQTDPTCRFFVGTQATGGVGLTLVAASTVVYYSQSYSLLLRLQSEDRAHRIGQDKNVTYVDLVVGGTVDEAIAKALYEKHDMSKMVLGDLKSMLKIMV